VNSLDCAMKIIEFSFKANDKQVCS
jgi:hypothetical protein